MTTHPWTVKIDGLVDKPGDYALEDLIPATLEERIYRFPLRRGLGDGRALDRIRASTR